MKLRSSCHDVRMKFHENFPAVSKDIQRGILSSVWTSERTDICPVLVTKVQKWWRIYYFHLTSSCTLETFKGKLFEAISNGLCRPMFGVHTFWISTLCLLQVSRYDYAENILSYTPLPLLKIRSKGIDDTHTSPSAKPGLVLSIQG